MTLLESSKGIYTQEKLMNLSNVEGVIFDCDGVLVDITESYDETIRKTVKYVLESFAGITDSIDIDGKIIDGFKATGGFNDEVDLTYVAILSLVAAKKTDKDQQETIWDVMNNCKDIATAEKYIKADITGIVKKLEYPGKTSLLRQIFNELFYGPKLYKKIFSKDSKFSEPGLIEQDQVILNNDLMRKLSQKFGIKIAMLTGRGLESVKYSLEKYLEKFDIENSIFLEDMPRSLAKPNPVTLHQCFDAMNCKKIIYVGDSMEDLLMAKQVAKSGKNVIFCGIIGTSKNPAAKLELFEANGAILALDSIHQLPKVLNLE